MECVDMARMLLCDYLNTDIYDELDYFEMDDLYPIFAHDWVWNGNVGWKCLLSFPKGDRVYLITYNPQLDTTHISTYEQTNKETFKGLEY